MMRKSVDHAEVLTIPGIPGLKFRSYLGESDLPVILAVFNACKDVDGLEKSLSINELKSIFNQLINFDPYNNVLIAEVDGIAVAFSTVNWECNARGEMIFNINGFLVPKCRQKGIGTAMLQHSQCRIQSIARRHPSDHPRYYQWAVNESRPDLIALLDHEGYRVVRYHNDMVRPIATPLPSIAMPEGLEVRPVLPKDYRKVWDANQEAFAENWGHRPTNENDYRYWLNFPWFNPDLWKVAWEGDQVVGMVLNYVNEAENQEYHRKRGYTEEICVRKPWRQRGLARSLLVQSIGMFKKMGFTETALGVDAGNESGALSLYESVGYRVYVRSLIFRKQFA
jgi:mycothiol synthase